VGTQVENETFIVAEGRGVAAMVAILVIHDGSNALGVQAISGAESSHSGS
jgi:hypothetical protein